MSGTSSEEKEDEVVPNFVREFVHAATSRDAQSFERLAYTLTDSDSIACLRKMLEFCGTDLRNWKNTHGWTILHHLAKIGNADVINALIRDHNGASFVNIKSRSDRCPRLFPPHLTPLHVACMFGRADVVKILIEAGASVNAKTARAETPLQLAVKKGYAEVTRLLIQNGGVDVGPSNGPQSLLHVATRNGHVGVARLLIQNGLSKQVKSAFIAIFDKSIDEFSVSCEMVNLLVEYGADVNTFLGGAALDKSAATPLHRVAVQEGCDELAKILIEHGAKINVTDENGSSPLIFAATCGNVSVAKIFIAHGAEVNLQNSKKNSALHCASELGFLSIIKLLVNHGANLHLKDEQGHTPLAGACRCG